MSNQTLIDAVRNWVHFDNLCTMLNRQMNTARNMRANFEEKVLTLMGGTKRLRIQGAGLVQHYPVVLLAAPMSEDA